MFRIEVCALIIFVKWLITIYTFMIQNNTSTRNVEIQDYLNAKGDKC